jgi:Tfp pilus assembly protein PilX
MVHRRLLALGVLIGALALVAGPAAQAGIDPPPGELQRLQAEQRNTATTGATPDAFERAVLRSEGANAQMKDSHERGTSTHSNPVATPDAFERAVLRSGPVADTQRVASSQAGIYTPGGPRVLGERPQAYANLANAEESGYTPAALRALGERWEAYADWANAEESGYTPAALRALGERWKAYADSVAGTGQITSYPQQAFEGGNRSVPGGYIPGSVRMSSFDGSGSPVSDGHSRSEVPSTSLLLGTSADDTGIAWVDAGIGALLGMALVGLGALAAFAVRGHGRVPQS